MVHIYASQISTILLAYFGSDRPLSLALHELGLLSNLDYLLHIRYLWFQVRRPFCLVDLYVAMTCTIELHEYIYPWTCLLRVVWVSDRC